MAAQTFESVLREPDNDASLLRLVQLIVTREHTGVTSAVAEQYLHAFCGANSSPVRRRWIGIALAEMIGASIIPGHRLKEMHVEMQCLGAVVLSNTELEETKIVAGIVMRQVLAHGIEYNSFWATDKVKNSSPNFPRDLHLRWMFDFQEFLDALHSLALAKSSNETSIMYPISVVAAEELKWPEDDGCSIALIQANTLTVIMQNSELHNVQFIDIPIDHCRNVRAQPATLYDSQAQSEMPEPWEVVLRLEEKSWTYTLNTSKRAGREIVFLFEHAGDAKEWESCVREQQKARGIVNTPVRHTPRLRKSCSSPIHCSGTPQLDIHDDAMHESAPRVHSASSHSSRARQPLQPTVTCSRRRPDDPSERHEGASQARSTGAAATVADENRPPAGEADNIVDVAQKQRRPKQTQRQHLVNSSAAEISASSSQPFSNGMSGPDAFLNSDVVGCAPKRITYSKGKLPRVSQSAKERVSKQLRGKPDVFDLPQKESGILKTTKAVGSGTASTSGQESQKSRKSEHKTLNTTIATRSQAKRKAANHDDDEFIPKQALPRKANAARKPRSNTGANDKVMRKKARISGPEKSEVSMGKAGLTTAKPTVQISAYSITSELNGVLDPQQTSAKAQKMLSSSSTPLRPARNGSLQESQSSPRAFNVEFKMPVIPMRSPTPNRPKTRLLDALIYPRTPVVVRSRHEDKSLSVILSSPTRSNDLEVAVDWAYYTAPGTEILSSNSKPVPASPNADSTAISGHADRDDMDFEKMTGDMQTAKSDPFQQRRVKQNATSFIRRLTGEDFISGELKTVESAMHSVPIDLLSHGSSDLEIVDLPPKRQPLPQTMPWDRVDKKASRISKSRHQRPAPALSASPYKSNPKTHKQTHGPSDSPEHIHKILTPLQFQASIPLEKEAAKSLWKRNGVSEIGIDQRIKIVGPTEHDSEQSAYASMGRNAVAFTVEIKDSIVTVDQPPIKDAPIVQEVQCFDNPDFNMDGDNTLVNKNVNEESANDPEDTSIRFRSSPPIPGTPSSHSSTSAESEPSTVPRLPSSEAEEAEWKITLNSHQRALHDLLLRTSKRVLRHIVNNETAVTDIVEIFERDGEHVLDSLLQQHDGDYEHVFLDMETKRKDLERKLRSAAKSLSRERKRVHSIA